MVAGAATLIGFALAAVIAASLAMSAADAGELIALAGGTVVATAVVAVPMLGLLRRRPLAVQIGALAFVVVAGIGLGVFAAARAMFISEHDLGAVEVVLLAAAGVGIGAGAVLGDRMAKASRDLVAVTQRIGDPDATPVRREVPAGPPELARLAAELDAMQLRLEESRRRERAVEDSRRELVAWVSHDLRTPLAALRAMVEAIEDGVVSDPETVARYHASMREQTERLAALVDDLFELSRTQAGAVTLHLERVSLEDLVAEAIAGVAPVAAAKGVRLEERVDGSPTEVWVSTAELLRALRNVLENAIRHTPTDGSVMVEAGALAPDAAYVSVLDSGGGVPERDLDRIFDVAYQGDPARAAGGAGLGLAIARGFVEAHRGAITVRNEPGGARFVLRFPREPV